MPARCFDLAAGRCHTEGMLFLQAEIVDSLLR